MNRLNRRGMGHKAAYAGYFYVNWPEILAFFFLIVGAILALLAGSAVMSYLTVFVAGLVASKTWWDHRKNMKLTITLMTFGFLVGFTLGAIYGNPFIILLSFIAGILVGLKIQSKGLVK